jgi:molybdopterin-guanine dinucleotide biosynthesis protein A
MNPQARLIPTAGLAYILVGGRSRRFGQDKALVSIGGEIHLVRLAGQLHRDGFEVVIVSQRNQDYQSLGLRQIFDHHPDAGPLAGMIAALSDCKRQERKHCWVVTCDLLEWRPEWGSICQKQKTLDTEFERSGCGAVAAVFDSEGFAPFPGIYAVSVLDTAVESWNAGNRSMKGLHQLLEGRVTKFAIEPGLAPRSFNTQQEPADLLKEQHSSPGSAWEGNAPEAPAS